MTKQIVWNRGAERDFRKTFDDDRHGHPLGSHVRKLRWWDDNGSTWRVVYVREYEEAICFVNAYQKKSKRGSRESMENLEATKIRLKWVEAEHAAYVHKKAEGAKKGHTADRKKGGR